MNTALVSICIISYNQKNFIREAIDGALMQQVDFPIEIIIADDCSTDGTREILLQYQEKHPGLIKLILQKKNVGAAQNWMDLITTPVAKYIAYLEGDDYWTDKNKLQKQVDFLEQNESYAICFHRVYELHDNKQFTLSALRTSEKEETYTIADLTEFNFIHTVSVVFRNGLIIEFPSWFMESPAGDYPFHMLNAMHGKIKYFPEPMAVYRRHAGATWSSKPKIQMYENLLIMLDYLKPELEQPLQTLLEKQQFKITVSLAEAYKENNEEEKYISTFARALVLNETITGEWISNNYLALLHSLKQKEEMPKGIKAGFKFLMKQIKSRVN